MARKRTLKNNKGLPTGWRLYVGSYRYQVPKAQRHLWDGKTQFTLGKTLSEAYRVFSERMRLHEQAETVAELLTQYEMQIVPTKAKGTQQVNNLSIRRLKQAFGHLPIREVKPHHVYKYIEHRTKTEGKRRSAISDWEVLRNSFQVAVQWGLLDQNHLLGAVRVSRNSKPSRYVEDWEVEAFRSVAPKKLQLYLDLKLMTGLRRKDILMLTRHNIKDDALHVVPAKTAKTSRMKIRFEWTDDLRQLVKEILSTHGRTGSMHLFVTRDGKPFYDINNESASAFKSLWERTMKRALEVTDLTEKFDEKSLRTKSITDEESDLENARKRGGHTKEEITKKVYRLKGEIAKPTPRKSTFAK